MKIDITKVLGRKPDHKVAEEYGLNKMQVFRLRRKLGIASCCKLAGTTGGNTSANRGHKPKGKHTNTPSPLITETLTDLRRFFAEHKRPAGCNNPLSLTRCAADTGISATSVKQYLQGTYIPCTRNFSKIHTWLTNAKSSARQ